MHIQPSEDLLKVTEIVKTLKKGEFYSYLQLEELTEVPMNLKGKDLLRRAFRKAGIEILNVRGKGYQLVNEHTTLLKLNQQSLKINATVKRCERTHGNLQATFFNKLTAPEQKHILYVGAIFGAIRASASQMKALYKSHKPENANTAHIPLPTNLEPEKPDLT